MKTKYIGTPRILLIVLIMMSAEFSFAEVESTNPNAEDSLVVREKISGFESEEKAKATCLERAYRYLKIYQDVICQPILVTSIRTVHWNSIVKDSVLAGKQVDESSSSRSSSSNSNLGLTSFILNFNTSTSSSSSGSSHNRYETPIYSQIHKSIPQYRDEIIKTYGYEIVTSKNSNINPAPPELMFESSTTFTSNLDALFDCRSYQRNLYAYRITGFCQLKQSPEGLFNWSFFGKNYFTK